MYSHIYRAQVQMLALLPLISKHSVFISIFRLLLGNSWNLGPTFCNILAKSFRLYSASTGFLSNDPLQSTSVNWYSIQQLLTISYKASQASTLIKVLFSVEILLGSNNGAICQIIQPFNYSCLANIKTSFKRQRIILRRAVGTACLHSNYNSCYPKAENMLFT